MTFDFSSTRGAVELRHFDENEFPSSVQLSGLPQLHRDWRWRGFMSLGDRSDGVKVNVSFSGGMEALISTLCQDRGISEQEAVRALIGEAMEARRSHLQSPPVTSSHLQSPVAPSHPESPPGGSGHLQVTPGDSPRARVEESSLPSMQREEAHDHGAAPKKRARNEFVDAAQAIFTEVDALPPSVGLLQKWRKELFKDNGEWMLRTLQALAPRGVLGRGEGYLFTVLQNAAAGNGNGRTSPKKLPTGATQQQLDEARLFDEMEGT